MNTAPTLHYFETQSVRTVNLDGEPWFVAKDVVLALGLDWKSGGAGSTGPLDDDEKGITSIHTPGGPQEMTVISESGLYTLILRCRDAVTPGTRPHRFRKWVTADVIPAIRRTGSYGPASPEILALFGELIQMQRQTLQVIEGLGKHRGAATSRPPRVEDIATIEALTAEGCVRAAIARELGLSTAAVSLIARGLYRVRPDGSVALTTIKPE